MTTMCIGVLGLKHLLNCSKPYEACDGRDCACETVVTVDGGVPEAHGGALEPVSGRGGGTREPVTPRRSQLED